MKSSRKLNIGIFIDHDIMIRHFIHSKVFSKLSRKHNVDFIFPPQGHKRVSLDPAPFIKIQEFTEYLKMRKEDQFG